MNHLLIVCSFAILILTDANQGSVESDDPVRSPNVLFIAVDDLRPELGCYGVPHAQSPHLDRFATQSVTFESHFVQVPTCGASRFALLTGRSPMHSRAVGNAAFYQGPSRLKQERLAGAQTFPELFRRSGYRTVCIGKISHTPDGKVYAYNGGGDGRAELPGAWDELATPYGNWQRGWGSFFAYHGGRHREDGKGNRDLMEFVAESDEELPDGLMASAAIESLRQLKTLRDETGQPFLLGLGLFKPHLPFVATRGDWDAFDDVEIPLADSSLKPGSIYWHRSGEFYKYQLPFESIHPLSQVGQRASKRAYLACVRYIDRQIGRVLNSLDELGLSENTVVVIWGDHGWHLGESAIWGKHSPFDRSLQSVLMIRAPGVSLPGHHSSELVESLDIYPTLVDICQPEFRRTAHSLDGISLRTLLAGNTRPIRENAISYFGGGFTARSKTHRFIGKCRQYPYHHGGQDAVRNMELYNLTESQDPTENIVEKEVQILEKMIQGMPRKDQP